MITYEKMFEILRIEKNRPELQELGEEFFDDCNACLALAMQSVGNSVSDNGVHQHIDRNLMQLDNIKRMIKELYDRREKKIIDMAINVSRTGMKLKMDKLLAREIALFDSVSGNLLHYRKSISDMLLGKGLDGSVVDMTVLDESENDEVIGTTNEEPAQSSESTVSEPEQSSKVVESTQKTPSPEPKSPFFNDSEMATVLIMKALDQVVGPDLQIYGPYSENAQVQLPGALANVLVEKGQARLVH